MSVGLKKTPTDPRARLTQKEETGAAYAVGETPSLRCTEAREARRETQPKTVQDRARCTAATTPTLKKKGS